MRTANTVAVERKDEHHERVKFLDKEQLKEMLTEMFKDGDITFNAEYSGVILVEIDGECVQTIKL
jgi:hypothetical protein